LPAIHVTKTSNMHSALIANPDPRDRLNLREKPIMTAKSLGKYYNGIGNPADTIAAGKCINVAK